MLWKINFKKKCSFIFWKIGLLGKIVIFCFSTFIFLSKLSAQKIPIKIECNSENNYTCSRTVNLKSLDINKIINEVEKSAKNNLVDSLYLACCYHQIAIKYDYYLDEYLKSIDYNQKTEAIRLQKKDGLLWKTYQNLGINYYNLDQYKKAYQYFKKALEEPGKKKAYDSIKIYRNLAECSLELGDIEDALNYSKKSITIKSTVKPKETIIAHNILSLILLNSKDTSDIRKSIYYSNKALALNKEVDNTIVKSTTLNNLHNAYENLLDFEKSISNNKMALELAFGDGDTTKIAKLKNNLANAFNQQKKYDKAIEALNESLELLKKYYLTPFAYDYSACHENLADNYTVLQQFDTALLHYQKALINLTSNFRIENIFQNPNPKDSSLYIYSYPDMIRVLHLKAKTSNKYYQQNDSIKYLNLSNQTYQTAFDFHDKLQKEISTENSRLFQVKNIVPYLKNALKVAFELQEQGQDIGDAAFRFMEKNKATVLLQSINESDALQFANLPEELIEREKDLKLRISYYKRNLNNAEQNEDTIEIERIEKIVFGEKQEHSRLIDSLEENYTDYYLLKYQQDETNLKVIQNQLNHKKAILEYFVGDSSIYVLTIQKNKNHLYQFPKPKNWNLIVNNFLSTIDAERVIKNDEYNAELFQKFLKNASALFKFLLEQPLKDLGVNITHLQIIPDGELNYIPFGLLLTNNKSKDTADYRNLPYLLKEKTISYAYSAALLLENKTGSEQNYTYNYAGFAPDYNNSKYQSLNNTNQSVQNISKSFKGISYINNEATKANFKQNADQFKTFQLAMHGIVDDSEPLNSKLIFTNDSLEAYELYNMKIPAELGVLSACETGIGKEAKGEGIMSLSRAFTYAGCNSLVMSLWSIEDGSTAEIVENFFTHLKKDKTKDEALRQAKLDFLQNTKTEYTHPIYWAGLVQSGNTSPIDFGNCYCCYWLILVIIVLLLIATLFFLKRKNRKRI